MSCISCKDNEGDFTFRVMEVKNRRLKADSLAPKGRMIKLQDLVGLSTFSVCNSCIRKKLNDINNPEKAFFRDNILTFGIVIAGIVAAVAFFNTDKFCSVLGLVCAIACIHRSITAIEDGKKKKTEYAKYSDNNARFLAAWEIVMNSAPRREGDARVSFIPVTAATLKMSKEELKKYYVLTSENAEEFYRLIHLKEEMELVSSIEDKNGHF